MIRRRTGAGIASLLAISLICGCSAPGVTKEDSGQEMGEKMTKEVTQEEQKKEENAVGEYSQNPVDHQIPMGESKPGNPLKGLIPFQGSTTDFPHSMEWFYLPVSDVQIAMNLFDWTALEEKLNACAEQGHQAVLRFYYDYPGMPTGVPDFLIDKGLELRPYNEPDDLGGGGLCPDYEDENLRKSMQNFISAFGAKYDGDARIAFVTEGLLGFWGEWHNWPFDEDATDGKPDWSISPTVYTEVLDAFENAFEATPLCVREPKPGVDNASFDVGYHDDSFAYATLTTEAGGQDWSYGQKLQNLGESDKWKTNCIGGEVYPAIQEGLFKKEPQYPDWIEEQGRQNWDKCVEEAHPSWLMCDRIKLYQDVERDNAIKASMQLGYDFTVTHAYFPEEIGEAPLEVTVKIKNIGVAPFYYDHTKWPVMLGAKNQEGLVARWKTDWDLSSIPADGNEVEFTHTIEKHKLGQGTYTLCMKVSNPLPGGALLWFANEGQAEDGWLELGQIHVQGEEKEMDVIEEILPIVYVEPEPVPDGIDGFYQAENGRIEGMALVDRDVPECMGGRKVGYIGKDGGSLYIENVEVDEEGVYEVEITYITKENRSVKVSVNEGEDIKIDFPPTGDDWTTLGTLTVQLPLQSGANTLHFHNEAGWAPDIDCIRILEK